MSSTIHVANALQGFEKELLTQIPEPLAIEISTVFDPRSPSPPTYHIKVALVSRDKPQPWLLLSTRDFDKVLPELVKQYHEHILFVPSTSVSLTSVSSSIDFGSADNPDNLQGKTSLG